MSDLQENRPIREEVLELATILADTAARLNRLVERLDEREEVSILWKTRYEDSISNANWLQVQNEELQRRIGLHEPEINNALDARTAAFRRLKHARKVIRDLLEERNDMQSPRRSVTQADIDEALFDNVEHHDSNMESVASSTTNSSSSSSSSGKTIRGVDPERCSTETFATPRTSPSSRFPVRSGEERHVHSLSPSKSTRSSPETVSIHFSKPPVTAVVRLRFEWEELQGVLGLENDGVSQVFQRYPRDELRPVLKQWSLLRRSSHRPLADLKELRMKFEIGHVAGGRGTCGFLYDPMFVDNGRQTFSICWGRGETNEELRRQIVEAKEKDPIFHTFTFATSERVWYYIGAHEWTVVRVRGNMWPDDKKGRTKIVKKLLKGRDAEEGEREMSEMVSRGALEQMCVELRRAEDETATGTFAQNVLGR